MGQTALQWGSVVTAPSLLHFSQGTAALDEGSPDINWFNLQVSDGQGVLSNCHFRYLSTSYNIQP